ncbi:MAG: hypothetical protein HKN59_06150 [Gammaproteobacteria bacterium]|nr:hypothetical protein [Gammaproteobacteria bacterium]
MGKNKIISGTIIGLVIGAIVGVIFNSGQINLLSAGITGGIIGFLGGWFMSRDDGSSDGDA